MYIRHLTIKVRFYLRLRFACRQCSWSRAFLASVQQESANMKVEHFPLYVFSIVAISWWKRSPSSSLTTQQLSGKKPSGNEAYVSLRTYCNQVCYTMTTCLNQFLVVFCPDIPEEVSWHQTKRVPSFVSRHPEVGCWIYRLWRACGPEDPQNPLFNFRFAESREFFSQLLERRSSPFHGF